MTHGRKNRTRPLSELLRTENTHETEHQSTHQNPFRAFEHAQAEKEARESVGRKGLKRKLARLL